MIRILCLFAIFNSVFASDITKAVFGTIRDVIPAAFGDFNSDELTDVFVLRNNSKTIEILLASNHEPLLSPGEKLRCHFKHSKITSVVPGDFDGDALMDVMVTTKDPHHDSKKLGVYILWGGFYNGSSTQHLNCSIDEPLFYTSDQPLAVDYNQDMIVDLFGVDAEGKRVFWIFDNTRSKPKVVNLPPYTESFGRIDFHPIRSPHSNAFVDLNHDFMPDLFITAETKFEVWYGVETEAETEPRFVYNHTIPLPVGSLNGHVGQTLFLDVELTGKLDLLVPICFDDKCVNSTILVYKNNRWHNLQVNFKDVENNIAWGFLRPETEGTPYKSTITLHGGDFNMDGYPDILATLNPIDPKSYQPQSFLLENIACTSNCGAFDRTYMVRWKGLLPFSNGTIMSVFYDFYQDGILDVILVQENPVNKSLQVAAFRNTLDYDANFIKIMVLTGLKNSEYPSTIGPLGDKKRTYGTNLPGPRIKYYTTTQEGQERSGVCAQLPQSAYFALHLPYSIFGLGRTPNFVDSLIVGLSNRSRSWTQIIPNSQMVIIPWPPAEPLKWKVQLFVTPSKLILLSVAALAGTCVLIALIIAILHLKERREDKLERQQESHRFHFDAM